MTLGSRAWLAGIAGVALTAVAAALVSQHRFDLQPCPWCVLQRLVFVAIAVVALLGLAARSPTGRRVTAAAVLLLTGGGIAAVLWQHFVAAASNSCSLTLADRILNATGLPALLPDVFEARATCADAAVDLFGLPYEFWALGVFVAVAAMAAALLRGVRSEAEPRAVR